LKLGNKSKLSVEPRRYDILTIHMFEKVPLLNHVGFFEGLICLGILGERNESAYLCLASARNEVKPAWRARAMKLSMFGEYAKSANLLNSYFCVHKGLSLL